MKFPGAILMGAQSRLLPPSVPFRFFLAAAVFHAVGWGLMAMAAADVPLFIGGGGPVLAALHAMTLGVLLMAAMGASFQILPVATSQAPWRVWPTRLAWWLYVPGVALLLHGFSAIEHEPMALGAFSSIAAIALFVLLVAEIARRITDLRILALHLWAALAALITLAALGFLLIADLEHGFIADHTGAALAHMIVAAFGFMGLLAFGFSSILVPMFALSPALPERQAAIALGLAVPAIILAAGGAWAGSGAVAAAGALLGLAAAAVHIHAMLSNMKQGMRKNLGLSFVLVRVAWGFLVLAIVLGGLGALDILGGWWPTLFGFVTVFGWLLTFLLGILQRIVPFLAAMNAGKGGGKPPRLSELTAEKLLNVHAVCHFAALALVGAGIAMENETLVRIGALAGVAGATAFLAFVLNVLIRMRGHWADDGRSGSTTNDSNIKAPAV